MTARHGPDLPTPAVELRGGQGNGRSDPGLRPGHDADPQGKKRSGRSPDSARAQALAQLAQAALAAAGVDSLLGDAAPIVAKSLKARYCALFAYEPAERLIRVVAGTGWDAQYIGRRLDLAEQPEVESALARSAPVLLRPRAAGRRTGLSPALRRLGVQSGVTLAIGGGQVPFGVLGVYSRRPRQFSREEVRYLQAVARVLGMAIERLRAEQGERRRFERLEASYELTTAIGRARRMEQVYEQVLSTLQRTLGPDRLAVLLMDEDGVMRFKAWRGLSDAYRAAVEGHSPWPRDVADPQLIQVPDTRQAPELGPILSVIEAEGIRAMAFVPLVYQERLLGKFMIYYDRARAFQDEELKLIQAVASHVAFSLGRMRAEEALRESDERLRMVVSNAPIVLFATNREGIFTLSEGRGLSALGMKPGEVVGRSALEMYRHVPQVSSDLQRALGGECFLSVTEVSGLVFECWYRPLYDASGGRCGVIGVATDISERRRAEEAVRRSEQKYRDLFEHANDAILVIDPHTHCLLDVNENAVRRLGYTREELLGLTLHEICPTMVNGRLAAIAEAVEQGGSVIFEHRHRRKDGTEMPVETSSRLIEYGGRRVLLHFVRDITERKRAEDALRRVHDELEQRVRERTATLLAAYERLEREIQERRRAEEKIREREAELAHVARLSTMGEMAATMAHELNQPLAAIANYAGGCLQRLHSGSATEGHLIEATEQISAQAQRAGAIIHRLRGFVRKREPRRTLMDVNEAVREAIGFAAPEARRYGVAVQLDLADRLPPVMADMVQIEQVILNLLRNGIEAMRGVQAGQRVLAVSSRPAGDEVEVAITDRGAGLPSDSADRLFHPFFTSKPHGMGMGLAISHSIVTAHGGRLWAEAGPESGTTFRFILPIQGGSARAS